jgi:hypothetical protein
MRRSKYGAVRTTVDGITFASKAEARRYQELKVLEKSGQISGLELQPVFRLLAASTTGTVRGALRELPAVGKYVADFAYYDERTGQRIIEDVKGVKTALYRWKKKHTEAQYGITITEVA